MNPIESVTLRAARDDDEAFLFALYGTTRAEELSPWGWNEAQKEDFLKLQFRGQRAHYAEYINLEHLIILVNGMAGGRLLISRLRSEIRIVDIALLPEYLGRGIGSRLIQGLFDEARRSDRVVSLHVEKSSRAFHLYRRLGFEVTGDAGPKWLMIWRPTDQKRDEVKE